MNESQLNKLPLLIWLFSILILTVSDVHTVPKLETKEYGWMLPFGMMSLLSATVFFSYVAFKSKK